MLRNDARVELTEEPQSRAGRTTRDAAHLVDGGPVGDVLVRAEGVREASSVDAFGVVEPELNDNVSHGQLFEQFSQVTLRCI